MPRLFQIMAHCVPMTYYLKIARHIILKGSPFLYVWKETAALFVFVVLLFSASIAMFRRHYVP